VLLRRQPVSGSRTTKKVLPQESTTKIGYKTGKDDLAGSAMKFFKAIPEIH
jgi:hypothetical protein